MSDGDGALIFVGMVAGAFLATFIVTAIVDSHDTDYWQTDAVAHGYAHYELDHSFHWNNEGKK